MPHKRPARRSRDPMSPKARPCKRQGSENSVDLGLNGEVVEEHQPAKKSSLPREEEEVEGSQSDQARKKRGATDAMAGDTAFRALAPAAAHKLARDAPTDELAKKTKPSAPPKPAAAEPSSSHHQEDVPTSAKNPAVSEERSEKGDKGEAEERDEGEADLQPPSNGVMSHVLEEDADLQPAEVEQPAAKSPACKRKRASGEVDKSPQPKAHQQGQGSDKEVPKRKSENVRRTWSPDDEVQILLTLADHRRQHGNLPKKLDDVLVDSIAERLQDKGWEHRCIKEKVRSLQRRYNSNAVSTSHHQKRLENLSDEVWGSLPEGGTDTAGTENGGGHSQDRSFNQMCELYPHLAQEVKELAKVQPALNSSFSRLDDKRARSIEDKLETVSWRELKIQAQLATKVEAPKAKIRTRLVSLLLKVSKDV